EKQAQRHLQRITVLREIDQAITSTLDLHAVLDFLLEKVDSLLPYSATTIRLFNKESGLLEPIACRNVDEEEWKAERWKAGRGTPNLVFETRAPVITRNVQTDSRVRDPEFFRRQGLVSYLGVPLIVKKEILGVLSFYTKKEHEFSSEEVEFLSTLAGQAAIAIHHSQLYEEMTTLAGELTRSNRVKDEFLSVMSHELRTPLNVVMGYTEMIKDGMLGEINPEQEKALRKVISRAKDQLAMITGILQTTQLEARSVMVERHVVSLTNFLGELRSTNDVPMDKELTLNWDYPSDLPPVVTDSTKLKHILQNLINNAIKFTEKGSVTISARLLPEAKTVEFKVKDTGIGFKKEFLPIIFEKFRQVDSSETRLHGGVGLGLYIVKQFTDMLGGKVEVESEPSKGSTFTVTIPYEQ
ncbi:MAG: ATP-binding protein, partial [Candidatus Binatia bacterium]